MAQRVPSDLSLSPSPSFLFRFQDPGELLLLVMRFTFGFLCSVLPENKVLLSGYVCVRNADQKATKRTPKTAGENRQNIGIVHLTSGLQNPDKMITDTRTRQEVSALQSFVH